jgi:hypothetical protein
MFNVFALCVSERPVLKSNILRLKFALLRVVTLLSGPAGSAPRRCIQRSEAIILPSVSETLAILRKGIKLTRLLCD